MKVVSLGTKPLLPKGQKRKKKQNTFNNLKNKIASHISRKNIRLVMTHLSKNVTL